MNRISITQLSVLLALLLVASCREDELVMMSDRQQPATATADESGIRGLYILCEGNMGSNKASVDYLDLAAENGTVTYYRNIFAERNPSEVKELGDVGNDIKIYGERLWLVINCSNKVEVASAADCKKIGKIDIPNCRYLAFDKGFAYVSSYVGPVMMSGDAPLGRVYKVDTLTLQKVDSITVGYQPEEMAVVDGRLFVANSGGYRVPHYDHTVTVIDLATFTVVETIEVAPNLHRCRADKHGRLWVTSRGDYETMPGRLYVMEQRGTGGWTTAATFDLSVTDLSIIGDSVYYISSSPIQQNGKTDWSTGIIDVNKLETVSTHLSEAKELTAIERPYALIVHPINRDFYLLDAKNYLSSGQMFHFAADGTFLWKVWTSDIPACGVFTSKAISGGQTTEETPKQQRYLYAVDEYVPAPGQFVNLLPKYEEGDDATTMVAKCTEAIGGNRGGTITLGSYGGYVTFHFDHPVKNIEGEYDFLITGNAHSGNAEPGVVMVAIDENGNGKPDDTWYELRGSADEEQPQKMVYDYSITYQTNAMGNIPWTDNQGRTGEVKRNAYHQQEYFPAWLKGPLTFTGTLLPSNVMNRGSEETPYWVLNPFSYGYVDNLPNSDREGCSFKIDWAVDRDRQPVHLTHVDFIRVYCAENQECGWIGETSTEVTGAEDLHVPATN